MQHYLYWIYAVAAFLLFALFFAWRRARYFGERERLRRRELEEMLHHKIKGEGAREMLDLWDAYCNGSRRHFHESRWMIERGRHLLPDRFSRTEQSETAISKRESIMKLGPKTFYYLDEMQVKDLYPQVFQEPEPKEIETQQETNFKKGAKAKFKLLEGQLSNEGKEHTKKRYEIELTPATMYNKVEEYLFENGDVVFGKEEFRQDNASIEGFQAMCDLMEEKFHFPVPEDLQKKFISDQMRSFAMDVVKNLADTSGYIALQSEFSVSTISDESSVLTLDHPLNMHIFASDSKVHIDICCQNVCMTPAGKATFTFGSSIKITCLGKIVRWDSERCALVINPIAIY